MREGTDAAVVHAAAGLGCLVPFLVERHRLGVQLTAGGAGDLVRVLTMPGAALGVRLATMRVVALLHGLQDNKRAFLRGAPAENHRPSDLPAVIVSRHV